MLLAIIAPCLSLLPVLAFLHPEKEASLQPPPMVFIKGGQFIMGTDAVEAPDDEKPAHPVSLNDFYLGRHEVTNAEFVVFLNSKGNLEEGGTAWIDLEKSYPTPSKILQEGNNFKVETGFENHPVSWVSWYGATAYCAWLSNTYGGHFRLPTEAEWEYAAGNGAAHTLYSWGNHKPNGKVGGNVFDITDPKKKPSPHTPLAFSGYADGFENIAPVEQFAANTLGLFDMTGNVSEWCADGYSEEYYRVSEASNPAGPTEEIYLRVMRGGHYESERFSLRCTARSYGSPEERIPYRGFRIAKSL